MSLFEQLKRNKTITGAKPVSSGTGEVFFCIKEDGNGTIYVDVVDKNGETVDADYRQPNGISRSIVHSIEL